MLTSVGVFLFTRFFIPEALLTFFLAPRALLLPHRPRRPQARRASISPTRRWPSPCSPRDSSLRSSSSPPPFPSCCITGEWRRWRQLRLFTGILLFLAIAAPWHILAGLRNPDQGNPVGNLPTPGHVHGFFYFYFINEHVLRFLGKRYPHDYNKQPWLVFWLGQLIWLFPWSLFLPAALVRAWRNRRIFASDLRYDATNTIEFLDPRMSAHEASSMAARLRFRARTSLLLSIYAAFILIFFSISTNQEYYTFPAWFALLMLIAGSLATIEAGALRQHSRDQRLSHQRLKPVAHRGCTPPSLSSASLLLLRSGLWPLDLRAICPSFLTSER